MSYRRIIWPIVALGLTIGVLLWTNRQVAPPQSTWADVQEEARQGGYRLITPEELKVYYEKDPQGLLLVDTRQEWEYRIGHIQGAVNFPMAPTWWSRWRKQGALSALLGPDLDRLIVFY